MNTELAQLFQNISFLYQSRQDTNRSLAYAKASQVLRDHYKRIKSGKQAIKLPGIGKSIAEKIDEYLKTGTLSLLSTLEEPIEVKSGIIDNEKTAICKLFKSIIGVGDVTAEKWFNLGYRRLEDLKEVAMTTKQSMGYKFYKDLQKSVSPLQIQNFIQIFKEILPSLRFEICGSFRRGLPAYNIECLVQDDGSKNLLGFIIQLLREQELIKETISVTAEKYLGLIWLDGIVRLDLIIVSESAWPYSLLYYTGSVEFINTLAQRARELGLVLNKFGLFDENGEMLGVDTENEIFDQLQLDYVSPAQRI